MTEDPWHVEVNIGKGAVLLFKYPRASPPVALILARDARCAPSADVTLTARAGYLDGYPLSAGRPGRLSLGRRTNMGTCRSFQWTRKQIDALLGFEPLQTAGWLLEACFYSV